MRTKAPVKPQVDTHHEIDMFEEVLSSLNALLGQRCYVLSRGGKKR